MTITDRLNQIAIATLCLSFSAGVASAQAPLTVEQTRERMALLQQRSGKDVVQHHFCPWTV